MVLRRRSARRKGAVLVESAVIYPLLFLLLFGLIVGGLGVFRFQQVACQAREAARWASVRGSSWQMETGKAPVTKKQIVEEAVLPLASGMDTARLTVDVEWIDQVAGKTYDWDDAAKVPNGTANTGERVSNRIRVTVIYRWVPELPILGPVNLKSVSEIPMSF
jgi:Flp pilus assembly protein TadG